MFKKLLITLCVLASASSLSAGDVSKTEDNVLAGVKQLDEEQMESVAGEDIYTYLYYPSTGRYELVGVSEGYLRGRVVVNGETGKLISSNIWAP